MTFGDRQKYIYFDKLLTVPDHWLKNIGLALLQKGFFWSPSDQLSFYFILIYGLTWAYQSISLGAGDNQGELLKKKLIRKLKTCGMLSVKQFKDISVLSNHVCCIILRKMFEFEIFFVFLNDK